MCPVAYHLAGPNTPNTGALQQLEHLRETHDQLLAVVSEIDTTIGTPNPNRFADEKMHKRNQDEPLASARMGSPEDHRSELAGALAELQARKAQLVEVWSHLRLLDDTLHVTSKQWELLGVKILKRKKPVLSCFRQTAVARLSQLPCI